MIKKLLEFIQDKYISRNLRKSVAPSRTETDQARNIFMKEVHTQFPFQHTRPHFSWKFYTSFAVIALIILNSTALIYADTTNVPVDHPLYTFKRVAEEVRGFTSSPSQKVKLETEFANRRLQELSTISTSTPQKKLEHKKDVENIKQDLEVHLQSLKKKAESKPEVQKEIKESDMCTRLDKTNKNIDLEIKTICNLKDEKLKKEPSTSLQKLEQKYENKKDNKIDKKSRQD